MKEIRQIIKTFDDSSGQQETFALATVVNVEASSYRRIGARMLVSSSGQWIGGISGGCLEGDALKRSQMAIFKNTPSIVTYDTMEDDQNQIGVGLGCNGRIEVLFNPIDRNNPNNEIEILRKIVESDKAEILLKIIEDTSTSGALLGFTKIADEAIVENEFCNIDIQQIRDAVQETRIKRRPQVLNLIDKSDKPKKVLAEFIRPETRLHIIGDNYDVQALIGVAESLGWQIYVTGRKKKMSKYIFEKSIKTFEYEEIINIKLDEYSAVVLMTHDFNWDKALLPQILKKKPHYLGILGPSKRMTKLEEELDLREMNKYDFFHSPVGLDIGAETPEEIALSITAEIIASFREREGASLKFRPGTIHPRE